MKPRLHTVLAAAAVVASVLIVSIASLRRDAAGGTVLADDGRAAPATGDTAADPWAVPADVAPPVLYFDRWETLTTKDGLPSDRISTVLAEGDDLYVGTENGFAARRAGRWATWGKAEGLPHGFVTSVARHRDADVTWLGTLRGLVRIAGGKVDVFSQKTSGLANDVVYHVRADGPLLWCATAAGISVLDTRTGSWSLFDHENSIMAEPWCYGVATGPERVWFAVWAGGIVELNRRTGAFREYRDPDGELEIDLLKDDGALHEVSSFTSYDAGMLWQTTYFGLARYDGHRWRSWGAKDEGLPGDFVVHVAARGRTGYIATDQGFGVVDGVTGTCVSYRRTPDGRCIVRTTKNGKETADRVSERTSGTAPASDFATWVAPVEGGVWVATGAGLSRGFAATK